MLLANFTQENRNQTQVFGLAFSNPLAYFARPQLYRKFYLGDHIVSNVTDRSAWPQGSNTHYAYQMAPKAGGMGSHFLTEGSSTAALSMASGRNMAATTDSASTASATLQLVVSLQGTSAGSATVTGNILAALGMAGTGAGSCTASATVGALAWAAGTSAGSCTATLTRYATGRLYGSISPFTDLSPENLASAVIAAAEASPIAADIRKVNAYTIDGDGSATPWGPV